MAEEAKRNLEPIEDKDLDFGKKFDLENGGLENSDKSKEVSVENPVAKEISGAEKDAAYSQILSKVKTDDSDNGDSRDVKNDAENVYDAQIDAQSHVKRLVDLAMSKGIVHAVKVARHLEDNYVLDMFHDQLLAEEFHNALTEKGLIK
ncbi:MAG: Uncharacterized protein Athens071425_165 [Parcubacteria group bacterium Athens0714_25]|nr:MAG: Uncharacterized protein Athens071425_165 [Parcubacteria group bacterium Athens0714_25]